MLELFYEYSNAGKIKQALLVGQNYVNQNAGDKQIFEVYFDYLLSLAKDGEIGRAQSFLHQSAAALTFFAENVKMEKEVVEFIMKKEEELNEVSDFLLEREQELKREKIKNEVIYNDDALSLLKQLLEKITKCENEYDFNVLVNDLGRIDQSINRERLSSSQEKKYVELTKKTSEVVSARMSYFDRIKNRDYNIKAIEAYEKVFNMFKSGEVVANHKDALKSLFVFDTSRLSNETLVYYNHVYNYILGKLSDEDKFIMTKYAIMCEKKR